MPPPIPVTPTVPSPPSPPSPTIPVTPTVPSPPRLRGASCLPATEAFAPAWGAERRRAVAARHKGEAMLIAVSGLLEETRRDWTRRYEAACARPDSAERHEELACLLGARDEIAQTTQELATDDSELAMATLVPLGMALSACRHEGGDGHRGAASEEDHDPDER
jgi:hypothetical protein